MILKIKKRNGDVVDFNQDKIFSAMEKAMSAVLGRADKIKISEMVNSAVQKIEERYGEDGLPDVEGVQDTVERVLMEFEFFDVVKAYILYRERHRELREEKQKETLKKIEEKSLYVIKRNGDRHLFNDRKLRNYFNLAMRGYEGVVDVEE